MVSGGAVWFLFLTWYQWLAICKRLSTQYQYTISFITLVEICNGLARGSEEFFDLNRNRLRKLYEPSGRQFLPPPGEYIRRKVFNLPPGLKIHQPRELEQWIRVLLNGVDRTAIKAGAVTLGRLKDINHNYGFDFDLIMKQQENGKTAYVQRLKELQTGARRIPSQEQWAESFLLAINIPPTPEAIATLTPRLEAEYVSSLAIWKMVINDPQYNLTKNRNDWEDSQQLLYLADPLMNFITDDSRIIARVSASSSIARIIPYETFLGSL